VPYYTWPLLLIYYGEQTAVPHLSRIQSCNLLLFHATMQKLFLLPLLLSDRVNSVSKVVSVLKIMCMTWSKYVVHLIVSFLTYSVYPYVSNTTQQTLLANMMDALIRCWYSIVYIKVKLWRIIMNNLWICIKGKLNIFSLWLYLSAVDIQIV
jgi:hypothetical protein